VLDGELGIMMIAVVIALFTPALVEAFVAFAEAPHAADIPFWGGLLLRAPVVASIALMIFLLLLLFRITVSLFEDGRRALGTANALVLAFLAFGLSHTVGTLYRLGAEGLAMAGTAGAIAIAIIAGMIRDP